MIPIGTYSTLRIAGRKPSGLVLTDGEEEVLLPNKFVPRDAKPGESLQVFVYTDSEDLPVATTQIPHAIVGDFAFLEVVDVSPHGVYMDWGLDKDLFVHKSEQHGPMRVGERYVVAVYLDERTGRVAGATRLGEFLDYELDELELDQEVDLLVYGSNERGVLVLVNDRHGGLIYANESFQRLRTGDRLKGYVRAVRDDNKLDISLSRSGLLRVLDAREVVLRALQEENGRLLLTDRSPPEAIYERLALSKKAFKAAVGSLYRSRRILLDDEGISLAKEP